MENNKQEFHTVDEYIKLFPEEVQDKLRLLRKLIQEAAPEAKEKISYQMPTYDLEGNLVHFAAFSKHIGFYPSPEGVEKFMDQLAGYHTSKGAIQFPLTAPLPCELIQEIVHYRVEQNKQWAEEKAQKKREKRAEQKKETKTEA